MAPAGPACTGFAPVACRYGKAGDHLYVREHWRTTGDDGRADYLPPRDLQPHPVWYEADGAAPETELVGKARRAFHMPRWASRITLEVTDVRVERLQAISDADALAEGIETYALNGGKSVTGGLNLPGAYFRYLWESVNGPGSWDANPHVYVISFKRIKP